LLLPEAPAAPGAIEPSPPAPAAPRAVAACATFTASQFDALRDDRITHARRAKKGCQIGVCVWPFAAQITLLGAVARARAIGQAKG